MAGYVIRPLHSYECIGNKSFMTYLIDGGNYVGKNYVWYIDGPNDNIIIDTSMPRSESATAGPLPFECYNIRSFEDTLGEVGLRPKDIDIVIQTHLHGDHCGNTYKCINARVVVQQDEVNFAKSPHPLTRFNYPEEIIDRFLKTSLQIIRGEQEIVDGIRVVPTPGHTAGGQSVVIDTAKGRVVLPGFCCAAVNFDPPEDLKVYWDVLSPGWHINSLQAYDSVLKVKELGKIILPLHDPNLPARIP